MRIDVLTLFPEMFSDYVNKSILGRAQEAGRLAIQPRNIRDFAAGKHRVTDEPPYGGGGGMVLKPEPIFLAAEAAIAAGQAQGQGEGSRPRVIMLSPQGTVLTQALAQTLAAEPWLLLLCGRYEGIDERVLAHLVDEEISIGDYVLTGGELPAMVLIDVLARLLPGVLGDEDAAADDSHALGLLEGPHYTRPPEYRGWAVPEVLRGGHAGEIARWRRQESLRRTWQRRPDLLLTADLTEDDRRFLLELANETIEDDHGRT